MTSSNINKIVQSNINLKPWVLSKNTSEIVNTYIQRLYKQMPNQFRKEKPVKVATPRAENKGPLRVFRSQETPDPFIVVPVKKAVKQKQRTEKPIISTLKASNLNNVQIASKFSGVNLTPSRRMLKSPNYKIYKARRFGSSASSSRSSLFRRYEERRRHRQNYPAQINYLIRSFHTSKLEPTYARYLMPARNQQLESRLGSIPDAVKFSSDIQSDLMTVDSTTRSRLTISIKPSKKDKINQVETKRKEELVSPSMQIKYREIQRELREAPVKIVKQAHEKGMRKMRISPEQREVATDNYGRITQMKHPKPSNELFTAQHDRTQTELHEKHRRNRMLKLGLIRPPNHPSEAEVEESNTPPTSTPTSNTTNKTPPQNELKAAAKESNEANVGPVQNALTPRKVFKMRNPQWEDTSNINPPSSSSSLQSTTPPPPPQSSGGLKASHKMSKFQAPLQKFFMEERKVNLKESSTPPPSPPSSPHKEHKQNSALASPSTSTKRAASTSSAASTPKSYETKSPIAMLRAQMPKNNYQTYRYNRADFFSTKKY